MCETLEVQKWQPRAKAVPEPWPGLFTLFPAARLPISPVCHSSYLGHVPRDTFLGFLAMQGRLWVDAAAPLSLSPPAVRMWLQAPTQIRNSNRPLGSLD